MKTVSFVLLLAILFSGCKKYDEGPSVSLLSKKARLTGKWEAASYQLNGDEIRLTNQEEITFNKNGTFVRTFLISNNSTQVDGNWAFSSDKSHLELTYSAATTESWNIRRMSNKQLFLDMTNSNGSLIRYEYVKKVKQ